jgi:hypothetical protein
MEPHRKAAVEVVAFRRIVQRLERPEDHGVVPCFSNRRLGVSARRDDRVRGQPGCVLEFGAELLDISHVEGSRVIFGFEPVERGEVTDPVPGVDVDGGQHTSVRAGRGVFSSRS